MQCVREIFIIHQLETSVAERYSRNCFDKTSLVIVNIVQYGTVLKIVCYSFDIFENGIILRLCSSFYSVIVIRFDVSFFFDNEFDFNFHFMQSNIQL